MRCVIQRNRLHLILDVRRDIWLILCVLIAAALTSVATVTPLPMDQPACDKPPPYSPYYDPNNRSQPLSAASFQPPPPQMPGYAQPMYQPHQQQQQHYSGYGSTIVIQPQAEVIFVGGCPACQRGILEESFTCCGMLMAICFFPLGVLCCLMMREKRCNNCGITFD